MTQDPEMNEIVEELKALERPSDDERMRNNDDNASLEDNQDAYPLTVANVSVFPGDIRSMRVETVGVTASAVTPMSDTTRVPNVYPTTLSGNGERNRSNTTMDHYW